MDKVEIVSLDPPVLATSHVEPDVTVTDMAPVSSATKPSILRTVAPAAGGFAAGILAGYGIYKLVEHLIAKHKDKKAAENAKSVNEEPKTEE
jgi:flagellar biosynthesis/type III secretory pathway M-ring protein FliF/YscJ